MLNREELKSIAAVHGNGSYYVSLYLNVNPVTNPGGEHVIRFKNMLREKAESIDKAVAKRLKEDFSAIDAHVLGNKRGLKKGLAIFSSSENGFWKVYNLAVPVRSELIVDKTPYIEPLMDVFDNYPSYAALLVDKESARIFVVHLGELEEYGEVHTPDIPGKHKKGGWFALSQNRFDRHVEHHVSLHLKDVVKMLEGFLRAEKIEKIVIGGSADAVSMARALFPRPMDDKVIGTFSASMFDSEVDVLSKIERAVEAHEKNAQQEEVSKLITRALKNEKAALGMEEVLASAQEGKLMRLFIMDGLRSAGFACSSCRALSVSEGGKCHYCGGKMEAVGYLVDLVAQKAVEQGAKVDVVREPSELSKKGEGIGALLRF